MNRFCKPAILLVFLFWVTSQFVSAQTLKISSPDSKIKLIFTLKDGAPYYSVDRLEKEIIKPSKLGFVFKTQKPLNGNFKIKEKKKSSFDETWTQPWGEVKNIRNHYDELRVTLEETTELHRQLVVLFRMFDDGFGFRYEFPEQENLKDFQIMAEQTEFALAGNHQVWWIPAYRDNRYEYLFTRSPLDSIDTVHTPLTMETNDGLFLSFHEAALTDYASMTLANRGNHVLECDLVPWPDSVKVKATLPFKTPWRTVQIAENPGGLVTCYLILNLNAPNQLGDVSWVKPGKYVGIWWEMHLGKSTWFIGPKHGATTANAKRYIDFAAKYGFDGVLVEGWNLGWDSAWWKGEGRFSFTTPYPDFDIEEVVRYAREKGVNLIGHNETAADIDNYESQLDSAFSFYEKLGVHYVKTGYVGSMANHTEWHHGQYMVRHYRKVVQKAAKHKIMLDVHEPIKDTGIRRTYPNMMTREGARGQEYNAWSPDGGNPPNYTTIIPFTRLLAGPFDFTPGIFDLLYKGMEKQNRVNTTLAKQLALYVIIYSPLQMAADLPENYVRHDTDEALPAFKFIIDVPVDWEVTKVLNAKIGDFVTIVRKDRHSDDWYLGSITDENRRTLEASLSFLDPGRKYVAEVYRDADDTDWKINPLAIDITKFLVDNKTRLELKLAPGGGQAIRFRPATGEDLNHLLPSHESRPLKK
jgi:alpha-glucosidase